MGKKIAISLIIAWILLISISGISAAYIEDDKTINNPDHAIRIQEINSVPAHIAPGETAILKIKIKNSANLPLDDLRINLNLPSGFTFLNDVNQVKISRLESGASKDISFNIIASQSINEGVYSSSIIIDYVSYFGLDYANIGDDKQDNYTFGLLVKANPNIIAQIESSEIYEGNYLGTVTIRFINNGVGNAKFLTAQLLDSQDYDVISNNLNYIGDLDSDDFESVDFRIKLKEEKSTDLMIKIDYKDSLNEDYSLDFKLPLEIQSAKDLGINTSSTSTLVIIILIVVIIIYVIYRMLKKRKKVKIA